MVRHRTDTDPISVQFPYIPSGREHAMAEENKIDRKIQMPPIKAMSLYASSADYERRLSEDCTQAPPPSVVDDPHGDNA
jgi:hypothetical protein